MLLSRFLLASCLSAACTTYVVQPSAPPAPATPQPSTLDITPRIAPGRRAHRIVSELLGWHGTDRYTADVIFLTVYVSSTRPIWAGARTLNGAPGTGGGYVELDVTSLLSDRGYPFQSTLVHELGHAFGLTHVTCYGHDLQTSPSIMGGNPAHWSSGLMRSATPGTLAPEDRFLLAYARGVFPNLTYDVARDGVVHEPARLQSCFLAPMAETIGRYVDQPGVGFELYYNGARVNGPDAALYSRAVATRSCAEARRLEPGVSVTCRYNGAPM